MDDYWVGECPFDGGDLYGDSEGHASWCDICGREFVDRKFNGNKGDGYEVEKEPKYKVRIKGFDGFDCTKYVNYHMPDNIFLLNDGIQTKKSKTNFTKQWLKNHWSEYDAYNNAGLLEFEEVEDE